MRRTEQTKLSDFLGSEDSAPPTSPHPEEGTIISTIEPPPRLKGKMWYKTINPEEQWGVCNFDGTVLLVRVDDGRMFVHEEEAVCKWCGGILEIRDERVFCIGACKRYQGEFSDDLNSFLHWEGVKSYTLRKIVADEENLELEPRDLEPISYAPNWSVLYDYADEMSSEDFP